MGMGWGFGHSAYGYSWIPIVLVALAIARMAAARSRGRRPRRGPMGYPSAPPFPHPGPGSGRPGEPSGTPPPEAAAGRGVPPSWLPDPTGRYHQRYWSGAAWTEHVVRDGVPSTDPPPSSLRPTGGNGPDESVGHPSTE